MDLSIFNWIRLVVYGAILQLSLANLHADDVVEDDDQAIIFTGLTWGSGPSPTYGLTLISPDSGVPCYWDTSTDRETTKFHPNLSPDGKMMVYREGNDLKIASIDGSDPRTIKTGLDTWLTGQVTWSPQGDRLAYFTATVGSIHNLLTIIDRDGNVINSHSLSAVSTPPSWSPDGTKIAIYIRNYDFGAIGTIDVANGGVRVLYKPEQFSNPGGHSFTTFESPVWSPAGDEIAFIVKQEIGTWMPESSSQNIVLGHNVKVVPAIGGAVQNRTNFPLEARGALDIEGLSWSPDGTEFAFGLHDFGERDVIEGIYRMPANGGSPTLIVPAHLDEGATTSNRSETLQWAATGPIRATVTMKPRQAALDETFQMIVKIRNVSDRAFATTGVYGETFEIMGVADVGLIQLDNPPPATSLAPGETFTQVFNFKATKYGTVQFKLNAAGFYPDGTLNLTDQIISDKVQINPLSTEVVVYNDPFLLNQISASELGPNAKAFNTARVAAGQPIIKNLSEVQLTLKNNAKDARKITKLKVTEVLEPLKMIQSLEKDRPGVPLLPVQLILPSGTKLDITGDPMVPPPMEPEEISLDPGETKTFTWLLEAFDANPDPEVDDSTRLEIEALVLGSFDGENIRGFKEETFDVVERPLLEWGIRPRDGRTNYLSGQAVRIDGFIENVSARVISESGEVSYDPARASDLIVMVYPQSVGNLGGGFVQDALIGRTRKPKYYEIFQLPALGEKRRVDLVALMGTLPMTGNTGGTAKYGVRLWIEEEDGKREADSQAVVHKDWKSEFEVDLAHNRPLLSAAAVRRSQCEALGLSPFLCGAEEGFFEFEEGVFGLVQFLGEGFRQMGNAGAGILAWEYQVMGDLWRVIQGDPAAFNALVQEAYVVYLTYANLGLMAGQALGEAPFAFNEFSIQFGETMGGFFEEVRTGDLEAISFRSGKFLGANPDLFLEPLILGLGYQKMARALQGELTENTIKTARKLDADAAKQSLPDRLRQAKANGTPLERAFRAGDEITEEMLRDIYGVTGDQLDHLKKVARDNDCVVTFRSRNPVSVQLLESGQAWPKPQALKQKTVNRIDYDWLGYRREAQGTIEIVKPPSNIIGKTGDALDAAVDAHVEELARLKPELGNNPALKNEVRDRYKLRATEWNDYKDKLDFSSTGGTRKIEVNFDAQGQFTPGGKLRDKVEEVGAVELRDVKTDVIMGTVDPVTGQAREIFTVRMSGPGGGELRKVTGDLDFLSFTEPNGSIILDLDRRLKIYNQLAAGPISMQHGESFTFFFQNKRAEYLRCCTEGGEAMVAIAPFGKQIPRAAYFVDNLSIIDSSVNAAFLLPRPQFVLRNSDGVLLKEGKIFEARRPDPSSEFIVIAGADINSKIDLDFANRFLPQTIETTFRRYFSLNSFFVPSLLSRLMTGGDDGAVFSRGIDALILQAEAGKTGEDSVVYRMWDEISGWSPISAEAAMQRGDPSMLELAPMTITPEKTLRGAQRVTILEQADMGTSGDFFQPGDRVVINPGGENQEFATVKEMGSLIFATPLIFAHEPGEIIVSLGPDHTDRDGDGLDGVQELALGTSPDLADTDFDGIRDNIDSSPLVSDITPVPVSSFQYDSVSNEFVITTFSGRDPGAIAIEISPDLTAGSWQKVDTTPSGASPLTFTAINPLPDTSTAFFRAVPSLDFLFDSDGDGLTSREEEGLGTSASLADSDGDGLSDGDEVAMGTDPLDPLSNLSVLAFSRGDNSRLGSLRFRSIATNSYRLESSRSLNQTNWTEVYTQEATSSVSLFLIPDEQASNRMFYRIRFIPAVENN